MGTEAPLSSPTLKKAQAGKSAVPQVARRWYHVIPGLRLASQLRDTFGLRLLLTLVIGISLNKGFAKTMCIKGWQFYARQSFLEGNKASTMTATLSLPFNSKTLIALVSDAFPILGYHKKYYLLGMAIIGLGAMATLNCTPQSWLPAELRVVGLVCANFSFATLDILLEGHYSKVICGYPEMGPALVSLIYVCLNASDILSPFLPANLSDWLHPEDEGPRTALYGGQYCWVVALLPMAMILYPLAANWINEERATKEQARANRERMMRQPHLLAIAVAAGLFSLGQIPLNILSKDPWMKVGYAASAVFIVGGMSVAFLRPLISMVIVFKIISMGCAWTTPSQTAFLFLVDPEEVYENGPHFSLQFADQWMDVIGSSVCVVSVLLYAYCRSWRYRSCYLALTLASVLVTLANSLFYSRKSKEWGIPDHLFALGENVFAAAFTQLRWMPTFLIISRICPHNIESTVFAVVASANNYALSLSQLITPAIGRALGVTPNGKGDDGPAFSRLPTLNTLCCCVQLIPLVFLWLIPNHRQDENILADDDRYSATIGSPYQRWTGKADVATQEQLKTQEAARKATEGSEMSQVDPAAPLASGTPSAAPAEGATAPATPIPTAVAK